MTAGGYVDDKIVTIRRMLKEGKTLTEIAQAVGYKHASSVRDYMKKLGLAPPSILGRRHGTCHSEERRKRLSDAMKAWHAQRKHHEEKGNREL